jgi:hypothetical protein
MAMVSVEYEYDIPNQFYTDHSFTQGKKRTTTYDGPDKIFLIVDEITGKETAGPITEEEKADGRPLPLGSRYFEVDCIENPLFCQLRGPVIDEAEDDHSHSVAHPDSPDIPGFKQLTYQEPLLVRNIYDKYCTEVNLETGELTIPVFTPLEALFGHAMKEEVTWDYIRRKRDYELKATDGIVNVDTPKKLADVWIAYRQALRDLPVVLANVPPAIALRMFPEHPDDGKPPQGEYTQSII